MQDFKPKKGLALVARNKPSTAEVQSKNGLLLPTQDTEETLVRGKIILVDDPSDHYKSGDNIVVSPDDIIGDFNSSAGKAFLVNVDNILGKIVS